MDVTSAHIQLDDIVRLSEHLTQKMKILRSSPLLHIAVFFQNMDEVERTLGCVGSSVKIFETNSAGISPLDIAVERQNKDLVTLLCQKIYRDIGRRTTKPGSRYWSNFEESRTRALKVAISTNNNELVRILSLELRRAEEKGSSCYACCL